MSKTKSELPHFGQLLRAQRQLAGFTLNEFSRSCRLDPADVSRWESGARKPPERPMVVRLIKSFDLDPDSATTVCLLAAAERERYEDFEEEYLLDVRRFQRGEAPQKRGARIGTPLALDSPELLGHRLGRHQNPIFTAEDDAEMVEQLMKVIRKSDWRRVSVLQADNTIQDIVRKEKKSSRKTIQRGK